MTLTVYTAQYRYRGTDRVHTTRWHRGTDTCGIAFAPPAWLMAVAKAIAHKIRSGWDPRGVRRG